MLYKNWLDEWLSLYVRPSVKEKTYQNYENAARLYIIPGVGDYELEALTLDVLQDFVIGLSGEGCGKQGRGLASSSIGLIVTIVQKSLRFAVAIGKSRAQYSDMIQRPKIVEKRVDCFSVAEQKKIEREILSQSEDKMLGVLLCLYTGLRIGELMALTWDDIDLSKHILTVDKTCHDSYENGKFVKVTSSPKTASSTRIIPLPKQLTPHLTALKKKSKNQYVISNREKNVSIRTYQRGFELLLKKLHIPHRGFHSLRHTFATRALECGMDVKTLSEILGHKNPNVTLTRYAHSMMEHKAAMMNKLGKMLG